VEFSSNESSAPGYGGEATGSVWFENAVLAQLVSMPVLAGSQTLPFPVYAHTPPTSQTNRIVGITDNGGGTYMLQFVGTVGVDYYVQSTTNLLPPIVWEAVSGSTNLITNTNGLWGHTVTNTAPLRFYRSAAVNP